MIVSPFSYSEFFRSAAQDSAPGSDVPLTTNTPPPSSKLSGVETGHVLTDAQMAVLLQLTQTLPGSFENAATQPPQILPHAATLEYVRAEGKEYGVTLPGGVVVSERDLRV